MFDLSAFSVFDLSDFTVFDLSDVSVFDLSDCAFDSQCHDLFYYACFLRILDAKKGKYPVEVSLCAHQPGCADGCSTYKGTINVKP